MAALQMTLSSTRAVCGTPVRAAKPTVAVRAAARMAVVCNAQPQRWAAGLLAAMTAAQLAVAPLALADLDTQTKAEGAGATIEFSDITNQDSSDVLDKLKNKILPEAKALLAKATSDDGSTWTSSVVKELETVETEVEGQIRQASQGGDPSNLKSFASGIEQQINALKALVGYD